MIEISVRIWIIFTILVPVAITRIRRTMVNLPATRAHIHFRANNSLAYYNSPESIFDRHDPLRSILRLYDPYVPSLSRISPPPPRRGDMRHTWCVAAFPPDPRAINRRPVGAWRVTDRKEFLHVSSTFLADPSRSRFNGRVRKKKEEKGEEQRERERERERRDTRKVSLGWRDESRRRVEIYARARFSSRSKRISLISLSARGGKGATILFFRDSWREGRGRP